LVSASQDYDGHDSKAAGRKDPSDMRPELSESGVVRNLAEAVCKRVTRKVIRDLQELDDGLQSGDDSGLTNAWEEICVQIQGEQSVLWDVFDLTVRGVIQTEVARLPEYEQEAIWLQTPEGDDWDSKDEDSRARHPVAEEDIVEYLLGKYVYWAAADWSNKHIRKFIEQSSYGF
jgi:hypothetical protein